MEVGKKVKIIYKDNDYSKIASGTVLEIDQNLIWIKDKFEGRVGIGKQSIIKIAELEVGGKNGFSE